MKKLKLTNTLTRKEEFFNPINDKKVLMYVCGVTPYDDSHLGHGRCYVTFDLLFRVLKSLNYDVNYVRNFTDIDDKLLNKAKEEKGSSAKYKEIADLYIKRYLEDMDLLGCKHPTTQPRVTENIPAIIEFIEKLIDKKNAYVVGSDVYFHVTSFKDYGKLSKRKLEDMNFGCRVEIDKSKKHPADFALWKGNSEELFWKSPWGYGRPGWHIECSVLAQEYLGEQIDIHGGGQDLIFPHHENEVAQSESLTCQNFANYWVHNAFVNINKEKMSKSLGNFFTLREVFKKFDPMVLRYYFLQHHYKSPIDFSLDDLESASKAYKKLVDVFEGQFGEVPNFENEINQKILDALLDDLNTPRMLGVVFENLSEIQKSKELTFQVKSLLTNCTGLTFKKLLEEKVEITLEIQELIDQRDKARSEKNWKLADELRDKLREIGFDVADKKS